MMAVEIKITIQEQHINRVLEALTGLAGKTLDLMVADGTFHGDWSYEYAPKSDDETNKEFAARVIRENIKAMLKLHSMAIDRERYSEAIKAISQPMQSVPDNIIK